MKVVLSVIGRFHFFDLARQLHGRGLLERIFTGYPRWKLGGEGIPDGLISTYPWLQTLRMGLPYLGLLPPWLARPLNNLSHVTFDRHVAAHMPRCDIFHGLSRYNLAAGRAAKARGARYICDVGSSHILTQDSLLREEHELMGVPFTGIDPRAIERELKEYDEAESITLPSAFNVRTFIEHGIPPEKIKQVPYGVDNSRFNPVEVEDDGVFRVGYVGALSVQKGIHYLAKAFAMADIPNSELVLIGSSTPEADRLLAPVANMRVVRTGHVPQPQLKQWMSRFHVKVMPSIQEGLALVLMQSQACGCPIIATVNSGAPDCIEEGVNGFITAIRDPDAIAEKLVYLAENRDVQRRMGKAALAYAQGAGTWDGYGQRMAAHYEELLGR